MDYLDTSVVVAAVTREQHSSRAQIWLGQRDPARLAISPWVITEFGAALSLKRRTDQMTADEQRRSTEMFFQLVNESFVQLPVQPAHFQAAFNFAGRQETGLRAGDALHIAIAHGHGANLCTLDRKMALAGTALGLPITLL